MYAHSVGKLPQSLRRGGLGGADRVLDNRDTGQALDQLSVSAGVAADLALNQPTPAADPRHLPVDRAMDHHGDEVKRRVPATYGTWLLVSALGSIASALYDSRDQWPWAFR